VRVARMVVSCASAGEAAVRAGVTRWRRRLVRAARPSPKGASAAAGGTSPPCKDGAKGTRGFCTPTSDCTRRGHRSALPAGHPCPRCLLQPPPRRSTPPGQGPRHPSSIQCEHSAQLHRIGSPEAPVCACVPERVGGACGTGCVTARRARDPGDRRWFCRRSLMNGPAEV
jgi:hypothetical protein